MEHHFVCDNCGGTIVTHCFDNSDNHRTYMTPVVPERLMLNEIDLGIYLQEMASSAMTTLCRKCFTQ